MGSLYSSSYISRISDDVKVLYGNLCSIIPHIFEPTDAKFLFWISLSSLYPLLLFPSTFMRSINSNTFIIFSFDTLPSSERLYLPPSASSSCIFIFFLLALNPEHHYLLTT